MFNLQEHLDGIYQQNPEGEPRPLIGITANYEGMDATLRYAYYNKVVEAGGIPVIIPPVNDRHVLVNTLDRLDALILFIGLIIFMLYTLYQAKKGKAEVSEEERKNYTPLKSTLLILLGLACLVGGSNLFVEGATKIAAALGVSEAVIGLTVVAGGTSLPELATSVVAARKGQSAIAMGNVIGSNVFNILMILGITGLISPMKGLEITVVDLSMMLVGMVLLWLFSFTKFKVERWEGGVLTLIFLGYMTWLVSNAI